MALRECPECGHDVSDKAETCPNCGHPLVPKPPDTPEEASAVSAFQANNRSWNMYELSDDLKNLSERLEYGEITPAEYDQIKADLLASKPTTETPKKQSKAWIPIAVIVGVVLLVIFANQANEPSIEETFQGLEEALDSGDAAAASCLALSQAEISNIVGVNNENWTGDGELTVHAGEKGRTSADNSLGFTHVAFLRASAPGISNEVFKFVNGSNFANPSTLLMGAESVARAFFVWGEFVEIGSPNDQAARAALSGAPNCSP